MSRLKPELVVAKTPEKNADEKIPARTLVLLGINHTTAPIEVRERLAVPVGRLAEATRTLLGHPGVREGLILSTCNRIELLTSQEVASEAVDLSGFLERYFAVTAESLAPHVYEYREREAVRHLFRVASSLDSMVVGEAQILGQVKQAWTVAREIGAIGSAEGVGSAGAFSSVLDPLLQRAFEGVVHDRARGGGGQHVAGRAVAAGVRGGEEGADGDGDRVVERVDCIGGGGPGAEDLRVFDR